MTLKLLVFDVDGTLTLKSREIPFGLQNSLRKLQREGKLCTIASGNAYIQFILKYGAQFVPNTDLILENGARIGDIYENYFYQDKLNLDIINSLDFIIENNDLLYIGYYQGLGGKYTFYTKDQELYSNLLYMTNKIIFDKNEFLQEIKENVPARIVFGLKSGKEVLPGEVPMQCIPNMNTYEVTNFNTTKASSLTKLIEKLNLDPKEVLVSGNGYNDISLFKLDLGYKVYVGDECPELENLATNRVENAIKLGDFLDKIE